MINDFIRIFDKSITDFKNYENKKEIVNILFETESNIDEVIYIIKQNILNEEGYIFNNLLSLYPFSSNFIAKVLESGFIDKKDLLQRLDIVFDGISDLRKVIDKLKQSLKRSEDYAFSKIEERLDEIEKELDKYQEMYNKKQLLKEKIENLNYLENEVKDIDDLDKYLKRLRNAASEIKRLNRNINEGKKLFSNICKDEE